MDKNNLIQLTKDVYRLSLLFPNKEPLRYRIREAADDIIAGFIMKRNDYLQDIKLQLEALDSFFDIASCQDWTSPSRVIAIRDRYRAVARELALAKPSPEPIILPGSASKDVIQPAPASVTEPEFAPITPLESLDKDEIILPPSIEETGPAAVYPMLRPESRVISVEEPAVLPAIPKDSAAISPEPENTEADIDLGEEENEEESGTGLTSGQILRQNRILTFLKENGGAQVWEIQKIFPDVSKRTIRRDFRSMLRQGLIERYGERNTTSYKLKINLS